MKVKHSLWLLLGIYLVTTGNPLLFNGLDLLGWIIIFYTMYKWILSVEFKEYFN